jgi:hypothetical protein
MNFATEQFIALVRKIEASLRGIRESLNKQHNTADDSDSAQQPQCVPRPMSVSISESIEVHKSTEAQKAETDYQTKMLFWQRLTFWVLLIYAAATWLMYCANKNAAIAAKSSADTARDALVLVNRPWLVSADLKGSQFSRFRCEPESLPVVAGHTNASAAIGNKQSRL